MCGKDGMAKWCCGSHMVLYPLLGEYAIIVYGCQVEYVLSVVTLLPSLVLFVGILFAGVCNSGCSLC